MDKYSGLKLGDLEEGKYYRVRDLSSVLKNIGLPYSIFKIMDLEKQGKLTAKRTNVRIVKGSGHRRYTKQDIIEIVESMKPM